MTPKRRWPRSWGLWLAGLLGSCTAASRTATPAPGPGPLTPTADLSRQTGKRVVVVWPSPSGRFVAFKYVTRQWPSERGGELMVSHGLGVRDVARKESVADFAAGWDFVQNEGQWDGETFTIGSAVGITLTIHAEQGRVEQVPAPVGP